MMSYLAMGGYAGFVWPAYAATLSAVALLLWHSLRARAKARRLVTRLEELRAAQSAPPPGRS